MLVHEVGELVLGLGVAIAHSVCVCMRVCFSRIAKNRGVDASDIPDRCTGTRSRINQHILPLKGREQKIKPAPSELLGVVNDQMSEWSGQREPHSTTFPTHRNATS